MILRSTSHCVSCHNSCSTLELNLVLKSNHLVYIDIIAVIHLEARILGLEQLLDPHIARANILSVKSFFLVSLAIAFCRSADHKFENFLVALARQDLALREVEPPPPWE